MADSVIIGKIQENYHHLAPRARQVADYILKNPRSVVYLSITELAEACAVSEPTVTRLCRTIGLAGYQELKFTISREFVNPLANIHEEVNELDDITDVAKKLAKSHVASIESTLEGMDWPQLTRAASAIEAAQRLEFFGAGNAACVAESAHNKFMRVGFYSRFLPDSHGQLMSASMLGPGDVAVAVSSSGTTKEMIDVVKAAKNGGATTICIIGRPNAPLAKVSDIRLVTSAPETFYRGESMENMIAQIYILDTLFITLALRRKELFLTNLEKTRKALAVRKL
ncbi:MAG: MurR/RpiR family transcriptional regulator [Negativicutes bacterium]|nr:MurR/RpiR family transcriptional regulator [Negativicutes bacterium]